MRSAERPTRTRWLQTGCRAVGTALLVLGRVDESIVALDESILLTEDRDDLRSVCVFSLGYLALAHLDAGRVERAADLVADAEQLFEEDGVHETLQSLSARAAKACVSLRRGDRHDAALEVLATAALLDVTSAAP